MFYGLPPCDVRSPERTVPVCLFSNKAEGRIRERRQDAEALSNKDFRGAYDCPFVIRGGLDLYSGRQWRPSLQRLSLSAVLSSL